MGKHGLNFDIPDQVLEFINAFLLVVCFGMVMFISLYLLRRLSSNKYHIGSFIRSSEIKLAVALAIFAFGDTVIRGPVWYMRHLIVHGAPPDQPSTSFFVFIMTIGTVMCCWGGVCAMRLMVPQRWGEWPWMLVTTVAFLFSYEMIR